MVSRLLGKLEARRHLTSAACANTGAVPAARMPARPVCDRNERRFIDESSVNTGNVPVGDFARSSLALMARPALRSLRASLAEFVESGDGSYAVSLRTALNMAHDQPACCSSVCVKRIR